MDVGSSLSNVKGQGGNGMKTGLIEKLKTLL
jgi:hypothetical protein